jgi:UDP-2-acetamido-2-deoxy-ribo-hexuluronate aminotransferase
MQFIDLAAQQRRIRAKIEENIRRVLDHGQYVLGPEIGALEKRLSAYVGVNHAISCASGTDALLMALMAYNVKSGDVIITTPFTFIATAEVVSLIGARPVFTDIDPQTFNLDPIKLEQVISKTSNVKGIIAVDLFGIPADYDEINIIAKEYGLFVIEDAAQSFGAEYHGKKACSLAEAACTSFFPAKPLGCYGDGGAVFTNDDDTAHQLRSIRVHGQGFDKYDNVRIGINGRMDTIQSAILLAKLDIFPEEIVLRRQAAQRYTELLTSHLSLLTPVVPEGLMSVWAQYSILARDSHIRKRIQDKLAASGIPTAIYYPKPLHLQQAFAYLGYKQGDFPITEDCASRIFSLPMHPYLAPQEQENIANIIRQCDAL